VANDQILRLHYYERQVLGAVDMEDQQTYHRDMRRRHNVGPHTWGIVVGLELVEKPVQGDPTAVDVYVQPGMAVDGFGREILVMQPLKLDPLLFGAFINQQHRQVWIAYDSQDSQAPQPGYQQCGVANQFGRIIETYKFVIDPQPPTRDPIYVGGTQVGPPPPANPGDLTIPGDLSVPYQEFPDDTTDPLWLVRLGNVNWDGVNQKFIPAVPHDRLLGDRQYLGVVADRIFGPAGKLTLLPRVVQPDPNVPLPAPDPDAADFAEVQGRLQVDGRIVALKDVMIYGNKLDFLDSGGHDDNVPLWMQRTPGAGGTGTDLRVHIGDNPDPTTRLSIGTGPPGGAAEKAILAVKGDDTVDIATGTLDFGQQTRQMINLWTTTDGKAQYGIGVQANTTYFRSHNDFCWFKDGKHADGQGDPGGGSVQLVLDSAANLQFGTATRQMLNLWSTNYGIGIQDWTMYFRSDADFCWFRHAAHSDVRSDPGGGALAMKLDDQSNLSISGQLSTIGGASVGGDLSVSGQLSTTGSATVGGNLTVNGKLHVSGAQNIFKVITQPMAMRNNGHGPQPWSFTYPTPFQHVYAAFVVLHGFSLWDNNGNLDFSNFGHVQDVKAIPQHVFVRIEGTPSNTETHGFFFCSESYDANELDNTVLFTVVVLGQSFD
jgi:hypothetical protein